MQEGQIRCILSGIKRFELTPTEMEFIVFAEQSLNQDGPIVKKIERVLEEIYWQKTKFIRSSIRGMLKRKKNRFRTANTQGKAHLPCT